MGWWNKLVRDKKAKENVEENTAEKPKRTRKKKSDKELATEANEPYVAIVSMDVDAENLHEGAFELDWNDLFVTRLIKAGYMMDKNDTDADIVDRWFQNVCRHVVMETWEQEEAMNPRFTKSRDIGDGRREVS